MGENFSGSCTVTSRNLLIHIGATTATKSECFDPKGVQQGLLSWGWRCVEESLATANFREFFFYEVRCISQRQPFSTILKWQSRLANIVHTIAPTVSKEASKLLRLTRIKGAVKRSPTLRGPSISARQAGTTERDSEAPGCEVALKGASNLRA